MTCSPATMAAGKRSWPRRYLSTSVVARRVGVSARTVRLWAECGEVPAIKVGRQWRIDENCFEEWLSRCDLFRETAETTEIAATERTPQGS